MSCSGDPRGLESGRGRGALESLRKLRYFCHTVENLFDCSVLRGVGTGSSLLIRSPQSSLILILCKERLAWAGWREVLVVWGGALGPPSYLLLPTFLAFSFSLTPSLLVVFVWTTLEIYVFSRF